MLLLFSLKCQNVAFNHLNDCIIEFVCCKQTITSPIGQSCVRTVVCVYVLPWNRWHCETTMPHISQHVARGHKQQINKMNLSPCLSFINRYVHAGGVMAALGPQSLSFRWVAKFWLSSGFARQWVNFWKTQHILIVSTSWLHLCHCQMDELLIYLNIYLGFSQIF